MAKPDICLYFALEAYYLHWKFYSHLTVTTFTVTLFLFCYIYLFSKYWRSSYEQFMIIEKFHNYAFVLLLDPWIANYLEFHSCNYNKQKYFHTRRKFSVFVPCQKIQIRVISRPKPTTATKRQRNWLEALTKLTRQNIKV